MACRGLKLAVTAALAANVAGHDWDDILKAFEKFQHDFERKYHHTEKEARFSTFAKNYAIVAEENAKGNSYKLAINKYADVTHEEFAKARLGYKPRSGDKPWGDLASLGMHKRTGAAVPDTVDWSQKGAVTAVKNQGQCGSCWAFSTTGALEGAWAIASGKLVTLSEQQLVDCSSSFGNQGCHGGLMDHGFKFEEGVGVCTEDSYAYTAQDGTCNASSCTVGIPKGGVKGFKDVSPSDEQAMMEAVAHGPVSVAIDAASSIFQLYHSGVLAGSCGNQLDHGVLVTGYGTEGGKLYWLVKNSWGASWGLNGYVKIARGTRGGGMCGILLQPSYPMVEGSPPAPPPKPPSPTPPRTHYDRPPCRSDEQMARIGDGALCAPRCDSSGGCPMDKPAGATAKPKCVLKNGNHGGHCALSCSMDPGCPSGAKCDTHDGVCIFPETGEAPKKTLVWNNAGDVITV